MDNEVELQETGQVVDQTVDQTVDQPEPPPVEQTTPVSDKKPTSGTSQAGFEISDWNGLPNYHCPVCHIVAYLNEDAVIDHILQFHPDQA